MLAGNDISQVIFAMLLGYYGNYGHRPRLIAMGVMCAAAACFVAAVPHFLYGPGEDAMDIVESMSSVIATNLTAATPKSK